MGRITDKPQSVNDAKNQLRKVTTEINYLSPIINPIKARPIKSATTAFMAGVALNRYLCGDCFGFLCWQFCILLNQYLYLFF